MTDQELLRTQPGREVISIVRRRGLSTRARTTLLLVALGFALRLFLIFPGPLESKVGFFSNLADLRNYYWPAHAAQSGANPYVLWSTGQSGEFRADMAPVELAIYVGTVAVWDDPRAIQILFALFDVLNIILLGLLLRNSRLRLPFQVFYALGPLTIYNLVLVPEDKTILLALTFAILYLLTLPRARDFEFRVGNVDVHIASGTVVILLAGLLATFKWLSVFYILPLMLYCSADWRGFIKHGILFGLVVLGGHLLWFPDWLYVYQFRGGRTSTPMHIAPAALLNAAGLFDKNALLILLVLGLSAIYLLFYLKRIDIFETIALATAAGILWTPDMDPVHLSLVVIVLLLVMDWTRPSRQVTIWVLSFWVAAVYALSTRTGFTRYGIPDLRAIVGVYGTVQMILLSYVMFVVVMGLYLFDKLRGRPVGRLVLTGDTQ
jgi:hypothetical protein